MLQCLSPTVVYETEKKVMGLTVLQLDESPYRDTLLVFAVLMLQLATRKLVMNHKSEHKDSDNKS